MKPAPFDLLRPASLDEALAALASNAGSAKAIAGGQSLVPMMNLRVATPEILVDLNGIAELAGIREADGVLHIGAMTRQRVLLESERVAATIPLLGEALSHVGHVQTRSRGTIGGSLAHADPSAELPLVSVALGATFTLASVRGRRVVPADGFFRGALDTGIAPDELLVAIALPIPPAGARHAFRELARRKGDFAMVAAAAQVTSSGRSVALGGVAAMPRRCSLLSEATSLAGAELERAIDAEVAGIDDVLGDAHASPEYRRQLARVLLHEVMDEVLAR